MFAILFSDFNALTFIILKTGTFSHGSCYVATSGHQSNVSSLDSTTCASGWLISAVCSNTSINVQRTSVMRDNVKHSLMSYTRLAYTKLCFSLLFTNMMLTLCVQAIEYYMHTRSISCLLMMTWLLTSPGHQQSWYWLYNISRLFSTLKVNFN